MSVAEKIITLPFFEKYKITESSDESGIGIIGFKVSSDDVYSALIAQPKTESGIIPSTVMISTKGCLVKLDSGDKTIVISMPKSEDKDGFIETFPMSVDNGEFFQSSLIHDYRHIDYEYIETLRSVLEIIDIDASK